MPAVGRSRSRGLGWRPYHPDRDHMGHRQRRLNLSASAATESSSVGFAGGAGLKFFRLGGAAAGSRAFIERAMRLALGSALITCTFTICPTFTMSPASLTNRLANWLT